MRYEWHLLPKVGDDIPLHLIWNPETGEIGGLGAHRIERAIAEREAAGTIPIAPHPDSIDAHDIRHSHEQMAALLGFAWQLPDELAAHYPRRPATPDAAPGTVY